MLQAIFLGLRFVLELLLLAVLGWWGWTIPAPGPWRLAAALACPAAAAVFWGLFVSPRRRVEAGPGARLAVEAALFLCGAGALFERGHPRLAAAFLAAAILDKLALRTLSGSPNGPSPASSGPSNRRSSR